MLAEKALEILISAVLKDWTKSSSEAFETHIPTVWNTEQNRVLSSRSIPTYQYNAAYSGPSQTSKM